MDVVVVVVVAVVVVVVVVVVVAVVVFAQDWNYSHSKAGIGSRRLCMRLSTNAKY